MTGRAADRGVGWTLAVTSSTGVMGLAVGLVPDDPSDPVEPSAQVEVMTERRHAEEISPRLVQLLAEVGVGFAQLDRLVIDIGPGRFTGLRVGLATVRALAFALDLPVVGLTSLAILAAGQPPSSSGNGSEPVTAVIDARRSEVFQQTFVDGRPAGVPLVDRPELLAPKAAGTVVGDGLDRYHDRYREASLSSGLRLIEGVVPQASIMIELSRGLAGRAGTEVQPLYLREPDATPNIKTRAGVS